MFLIKLALVASKLKNFFISNNQQWCTWDFKPYVQVHYTFYKYKCQIITKSGNLGINVTNLITQHEATFNYLIWNLIF